MEINKNAHEEHSISFDKVYRIYYKQILAYLLKQIGNQADAEDLTSEVFLYCYNNFNTYDASKSSISTWIYLIAKSRFYNYCRNKKITENIDDYANLLEDTSNFIEQAIYLEELRSQLNKALNFLTERQKTIIILKYFEEKSAEEIGERLGISANNVRVQLSKALKKLKSIMEKWS